jgi:arginine/lysine/histidine/glutamine transport system substrate-binding and permease protein
MRRLLAVAIVVLVLGAVACNGDGDGDGTTGSGPPPPAPRDLRLLTPETVSVASDIPDAPFELTNPGSNEVVGFDVDLVRAIAATLGIRKVTFVKQPRSSIIPSVKRHRFDMAAASFVITPERAGQIDFGDPYLTADQSVMVQASSDITGLDGLEGKTIGGQRGTTGADLAATVPDATVKRYDTIDAAYKALAQGWVDAVVNGFAASAFAATKKPRLKVVDRVTTKESYGLVFPKDNPALRDAFNTGLAEIKANGTYDEIYKKWFHDAPPG